MTRTSGDTRCNDAQEQRAEGSVLRIATLERLAALGIELAPIETMQRHAIFTRGGFASLVERVEGGFGRTGTPGIITDRGFAMLIWRDGKGYFVAHGGWEQRATDEQVAGLRQFSSDLERVLRAC